MTRDEGHALIVGTMTYYVGQYWDELYEARQAQMLAQADEAVGDWEALGGEKADGFIRALLIRMIDGPYLIRAKDALGNFPQVVASWELIPA